MAYSIALSPALEQELKKRLRGEKQVKIHRRLKFIEYKSKGISNGDAALALGVCIDTLTNWVKIFLDSGFDGLCNLRYEGRRYSKMEPHKEEIKTYIRENMPSTLAELNGWLKKNYGFQFDETWLSRWCKKNSLPLTKKQNLYRGKLRGQKNRKNILKK